MRTLKGQANAIATVTSFLIFSIIVIVGSIVYGLFDAASGSIASTTAATQAISNISTNTYSGINVVSVGPIVLAAVAILGIVGLLARR